MRKCCICGNEFEGWGNNPFPVVKEEGKFCCDECNINVVLVERMVEIYKKEHRNDD